MGTTLMMSAKMTTSGLLKIKVFWNKDYGVISSVYDVTNKILSWGLIDIVEMVIWPDFGNSSISFREVNIILNFIKIWLERTLFWRSWSYFKFNNFGLALGTNLKFYTSFKKWLKLKVKKLWWLIPKF